MDADDSGLLSHVLPRYRGVTGTRWILVIGLAVAATASVALAGDAGARYESGRIASAAAAITAVKPWLPGDAVELRVTRVVLVKENGELPAVLPEFGRVSLTPKGFPGPIWVVVVRARCDGVRRSQKLVYIFEASTGAEVIRSGLSCDLPPPPLPSLTRRTDDQAEVERTELERRIVDSEFIVCAAGCREYRRTQADCRRVEARLNERPLFRCRIQNVEVGGNHRARAETVCAALGRYGDRGYEPRPLAECR